MGLFDWIFGRKSDSPEGRASPARFGMDDLARRVGLSVQLLRSMPIAYHEFEIPKRSGGFRRISSPDTQLKSVQRLILGRVLGRLRAHDCAHGFEVGRSIVTNALPHQKAAVVLKIDIRDFFPRTTAKRVNAYFRQIGWDTVASAALTRLCTHQGGLPQGAATSPRLSNVVNYQLDSRLAGAARGFRAARFDASGEMLPPEGLTPIAAAYTRYADDITFSLATDVPYLTHSLLSIAKKVLRDYGYELHQDRKLQIRRRYERQMITGLVVNDGVQLPRETRRRLRAIRHSIARGRPITLTPQQWAGWESLERMIASQSDQGM
ncbi:MAG TPA: reverse transcriptase family protein [Tepidisphaeraceae bacterium]|nr:reverse transcriptase family protein [Tepidisphaeraceae bacterium]